MSDCFDPGLWLELLDSRDTAGALDAHLASCESCSDIYIRLQQSEERIREVAKSIRGELDPARSETDGAWERLMASWSETEPKLISVAGGALTLGRLMLLERLVRPFCGARMATLAIVQAARQTHDASLSTNRWNALVHCLAEFIAAMGGETLRRMVVECGQQIP